MVPYGTIMGDGTRWMWSTKLLCTTETCSSTALQISFCVERWMAPLNTPFGIPNCPVMPKAGWWILGEFAFPRYTVSDNSTSTYFNILKQVDRCSQSQMLKQIAETPIALTWHTAISKGLLVFVLLRTANKSIIIKYNGRSRWHVHSTPPVPLFLTIHNRRASSVHGIGVWEEEVERSFR